MKTQFVFSEKRNLFWLSAIFTAVVIVVAVVCAPLRNSTCVNTTTETFTPKWHRLPKAPYVYEGYDYKKILRFVMKDLAMYGPDSYFGDGVIDCKDWTMTFLCRWYNMYDGPDGTCIIVRNVNRLERFDHLFVAVWTGERWIFIEPQACKKDNWTLKSFWGSRYDVEYNCYNETRKFILCAFKNNYGEKLIQKTLVDDTYTWQYWDDSHPIQYHTDMW